MDLVLTGCVSESAVLALSKEILFERGTLPVGEIGKVLQELTCASSFLGKLKEKFGGLKKFLERFPDEFMICTDHPFNPHVFVKKALNAEELEMVAKGIVPPHLTAKYKKVSVVDFCFRTTYLSCRADVCLTSVMLRNLFFLFSGSTQQENETSSLRITVCESFPHPPHPRGQPRGNLYDPGLQWCDACGQLQELAQLQFPTPHTRRSLLGYGSGQHTHRWLLSDAAPTAAEPVLWYGERTSSPNLFHTWCVFPL
jgi:hypothetical protein